MMICRPSDRLPTWMSETMNPSPAKQYVRNLIQGVILLQLIGSVGCAALTNPVADGVPVNQLPEEFRGFPREKRILVKTEYLAQPSPDPYRVDAGDLLGIVIEGFLGKEDQIPPIQIVNDEDELASIGYPALVQEDGNLTLPSIDPINVKGMSLAEIKDAIIKAYSVDKDLLLNPDQKVIVTLRRKRRVAVLVLRQDSGQLAFGPGGTLNNARRGTGVELQLPAYKNDVLNALVRSGGLPGLDAVNEVVIQRGLNRQEGQSPIVRIPLRIRPDEPIAIRPEDVILNEGDTIIIQGRESEVFYTGGLLPARQVLLPQDFSLDVVTAIASVNGPLVNGGFNQNSGFSQTFLSGGIGFPSPSLVSVIRRLENGRQMTIRVDLNKALRDERERPLIQPGDILILQETPGEALARYFSSAFRFNFTGNLLRGRDGLGVGTFAIP